MSESRQGATISQDGGFNKFTWMLLAGFGSVMILISCAALSKLWALGDRVADQAGDIRVILANQTYQGQNASSLASDMKDLRTRLADIERRQLESRNVGR